MENPVQWSFRAAEGMALPEQYTPVLSGDLNATGWDAVCSAYSVLTVTITVCGGAPLSLRRNVCSWPVARSGSSEPQFLFGLGDETFLVLRDIGFRHPLADQEFFDSGRRSLVLFAVFHELLLRAFNVDLSDPGLI